MGLASSDSERSGTVDFIVGTKTYQTWYMVVGDLKGGRRPVVALHGGPGMSHHYMLPHVQLFTRASIPVVLYDQLGNGQSSHIHDVPQSFWCPELFMDELDNLLKKLELSDDFDLLGHSWGGQLAGSYAALRQPQGLKRLIIANSPASIPLFMAGANELLDRFPPSLGTMIRKYEAEGNMKPKEYQDGVMEWCKRHICTLDPWPEQLLKSFGAAKEDPTVHRSMMGGYSFKIIGNLKNWSIIDDLHKIKYPTLLISSPTDEIQEAAILPWFLRIPKVKWVELQNSSHLAEFEEPDRYFEVIINFLDTITA
ncbi:L-amino acid amidase [Hypsizygus marmoreus]|uniref:L-amino acid amidase n=1 Tax=Hypsizygus marmoreus TaxID=39966 RepID=A0A369JUL7_HYPMA|nr:L-amino acid amidase [Hypsizygus marmoreus]